MINPFRSQMASFLTKSAHEGLEKLDKNSSLARKLKTVDVDAILKYDINKICEEMSCSEMVKLTTLAGQVKSGLGDEELVKEDVKNIAKDIVKRVEKKSGSLKITSDLRDLLFNL